MRKQHIIVDGIHVATIEASSSALELQHRLATDPESEYRGRYVRVREFITQEVVRKKPRFVVVEE